VRFEARAAPASVERQQRPLTARIHATQHSGPLGATQRRAAPFAWQRERGLREADYCFLLDGWGAVESCCRCSLVVRWGSFLFRRWGPRGVCVGAVSASQLRAGPSGGREAAGACRGRVGPAWRGGLERLVAAQDVPGGDQDLAGDGGFGGVRAGAFGDVGVELVPGVGGPPGVLGGFEGGPAQRPRARLRQGARP
jgi:hypothetical protein